MEVSDPESVRPIRVLLVDDHALLLDGLEAMIAAESDMTVAGRASNRVEAVERAKAQRPDVAVVDLVIPGGGLKAIREIVASCPTTRVIALTVLDDPEHLRAVAYGGGSGYLVKRVAARELLAAIRTVHSGTEYWGSAGGVRPEPVPCPVAVEPADLSARETQVLRLLARGFTHKEIAGKLEISKKSVDTYRLRLQEKLGVRGRADLVRYAIASGLFGESEPL